jgi:hypothetical protein
VHPEGVAPRAAACRTASLLTDPISEFIMVLCPVALAVGCRKCPILAICPVKGIIGDYRQDDAAVTKKAARKTSGGARKK